jgi:hypothetical protein
MTERIEIIWILSITHKHGTTVTAHRNQEGALDELANYVAQFWLEEMGDEAIPSADGDAIQAYFAKLSDREYFSIEECELQP